MAAVSDRGEGRVGVGVLGGIPFRSLADGGGIMASVGHGVVPNGNDGGGGSNIGAVARHTGPGLRLPLGRRQ